MARLPPRLCSRAFLWYGLWARLSLFRHGKMDHDILRRCWEHSGLESAKGITCMELGPGDSLFSALIARSWGASRTYLVDTGHYASSNVRRYQSMARFLAGRGAEVNWAEQCATLEQFLEASSALYFTEGLRSLAAIPDGSVYLIWSNAVLEHVRRREFLPLMRELRRVQSPDGAAVHCVNLKDHLDAALNNLRFREKVWESEFMARSGFYTNRIRMQEIIVLFREAGYETIQPLDVTRWPSLPTPRRKLASPFRELLEEDLTVSGFTVVLR